MTDTKLVFRDEPIQQSSSKIIQWFGLDQFEPERALTSHFVSSKSLFWIRLPLVLYSFIVMWVDIIYTAETGGFRQFFAYFTDLTFIGMHAYLMVSDFRMHVLYSMRIDMCVCVYPIDYLVSSCKISMATPIF